jgi:hypothetical protein
MELPMSTQSLAAVEPVRRGRPRDRRGDKSTLLTYQLNVIAADVCDVVQSVGGWLFDRSMLGWRVNAWLIHHNDDTRALRILGVQTSDLTPALLSVDDGVERPAGLAIASDLLGTDQCIDAFLDEALQGGETEVSLWGGSPSAEGIDSTQYRLSDAARTFKAHALAAAGLMDAQIGPFELLLRSDYP